MSAEIQVTITCNDCGTSRSEPAAGIDVLKRVRQRLATQGWWNETTTRGPGSLRKDLCPGCRNKPKTAPGVGDYVLATKYADGDPCDHFCVGFVQSVTEDRNNDRRYNVVDDKGMSFRANGFRRAEKITKEEGHRLVDLFAEIGDRPGPSLWTHLHQIRQAIAKVQ